MYLQNTGSLWAADKSKTGGKIDEFGQCFTKLLGVCFQSTEYTVILSKVKLNPSVKQCPFFQCPVHDTSSKILSSIAIWYLSADQQNSFSTYDWPLPPETKFDDQDETTGSTVFAAFVVLYRRTRPNLHYVSSTRWCSWCCRQQNDTLYRRLYQVVR